LRALAGGGRYDGLIKGLSDGHVDLPAIGFGMGDVVLGHLIDETSAAAAQLQSALAASCDVYVIIADESKAVAHLGTKFPVPVEIASLARLPLTRRLEALGAKVVLRYGKGKAGPVVTDNGNLILDLTFEHPVDCGLMEAKIQTLTGVIEVGLFAGRAQLAYLGRSDGTCDVLTPRRD
jgi:ribose 5-phosphate isomerase A